MPFSASAHYSDKERWICIYPVYLNSRVTRSKGRKISIDQGVDNPKHTEICAILQNLGFRHLAENKVYPRERDSTETQNRWRIRVQLKNDDGSPCLPEYVSELCLTLQVSHSPIIVNTSGRDHSSSENASFWPRLWAARERWKEV
ncbi:unnamed protein product [Hydatigera taeniaeformis]|uniref:Signal recognition particle 19 kDa protein n=1 Tax=Hydatigena taeniaeformis TaxID=6205 RepID=A0A3P7G1A0_HYDTA|nr:unnamed protein product [Hydatigera taeniaeformis]